MRRPLRDMPVRRKFVLITLAATATALVAADAALFAFEHVRFRIETQRDLLTLAGIIGENSTAALSFRNERDAVNTLAPLSAKPEVTAAAILDEGRQVFASYRSSPSAAAIRPEDAPESVRFEQNTITVARKVQLDRKTIGTVVLRADLSRFYARLRSQAISLTLILLGCAVLALAVASRLARFISRPILNLAETARTVSMRADYGVRAVKLGQDEVGELVDAFNTMLDQIEARDAALQSIRSELEDRVRARTAQLELELAERQRAEAELARRNADLAQSNRDLDDFAYIASHDLKEPLRGIHNYSRFLLEDYGPQLDAEANSRLETLARLTERMGNLLDSLLYYSRVGRADLAIQTVDLGEVAAEVIDSLHIGLRESQVEVRIPRALPRVRCDKVRIGEVYRNLIANAMKFNDKDQRWIELGSLSAADAATGNGTHLPAGPRDVVLYVRDNGIGIPPKHFDSIFRIFRRLHGRNKFGGGVGAGLTIVKKIVERHAGTIWVESEPGSGTTFFISLPGALT